MQHARCRFGADGDYLRNRKQSREGMDIEKYVRETLGSMDDRQSNITWRERIGKRWHNTVTAAQLRFEIVQCAVLPLQIHQRCEQVMSCNFTFDVL